MPRKLRFFLTKNHERKRQQTVLQHSASHRPLPVMKVSIPISYFLLSPTKNVQELCQRIDVFNLPSEWKEHKELRQNCALLFTSTIVYSGTNLLALAVKINDSLNWSLSCNGQEVSINECTLFQNLPQKITNFQELHMILQTFTKCQFCSGNNLTEFLDVLSAEEITTANQIGKSVLLNKIELIIIFIIMQVKILFTTNSSSDATK